MTIPLSATPPGAVAVVVDVDAGPGLRSRLMNMGFVAGARVRVLENGGGHLLVSVGEGPGRTVVLSRGAANKIIVEVEARPGPEKALR
jgi:ferrous iron transport protein A